MAPAHSNSRAAGKNAEQLEQTFLRILFDSFKGNSAKEEFLRQQFSAENPELLDILNQYSNPASFNNLRYEMQQFVTKHLGPDFYTKLSDAIGGLYEKGHLKAKDRDMLKMLSLSNDKHLMAAWDAYAVMHDEEDFADSLQVLCEVKR